MKLKELDTAFDVLAVLCAMITKENERRYALKWSNASQREVKRLIARYKKFIAIILNSSTKEYKLNIDEIEYINDVIEALESTDILGRDEVYHLAIEVENKLGPYSEWQCSGAAYRINPLNKNVEETGIAVYPYFSPQWNTDKSERTRSFKLNTKFQNYMIVRAGDQLPFAVIMHYWNDQGILRKTNEGWSLKIAVAPVTDSVELKLRNVDSVYGKGILVEGIANESEVEEKALKIYDAAVKQNCGLIMFPEVIGTQQIIDSIKSRMRMCPEVCAFTILPTFCSDGHNVLVVLGPGGIEITRQEKTTPFFLRSSDGEFLREELQYTNEMHVLITKELGNVAFPICAEFLEPEYYPILSNVAHVDTVFCPSFSPGIGAFEKTMLKGLSDMKLSVWVNTCSAKTVSANGRIPESVAMVQLPDAKADGSALYKLERPCHGENCSEACYFVINIEYRDSKFYVEGVQRQCA